MRLGAFTNSTLRLASCRGDVDKHQPVALVTVLARGRYVDYPGSMSRLVESLRGNCSFLPKFKLSYLE